MITLRIMGGALTKWRKSTSLSDSTVNHDIDDSGTEEKDQETHN